MGRNLERNHSTLQFEKYYRSCIWGLLPLQFQSFKKLMPHIKQKHVRISKAGPNTDSNESNECQEFEDGSSDSSFTDAKNTRKNITINASKNDSGCKGKVPQQPRFRRTYSIHHLEPSSLSNLIDGSNVDHKHPVVIHNISDGLTEIDKIASHPTRCANADVLDDEQVARNLKHFGELDLLDQGAVDDHQSSGHIESSSETYEVFFNAFQIDKKLFMRSKQNYDATDSANCQVDLKSRRRANFKRSGSFPMANNHCNGYGSLTPSKLETKLNEVRPSSSSGLSTSSSSFCSSENILQPSHSCTLPVNMCGELATEYATQNHIDEKAHDYASNVRRYKLSRIRRASSLNDKMERYTQLFETSFRGNAKLNVSKSLRLSNEDEVGFKQSDSVILRKVQSMREVLQAEWASDSIELSKLPNKSASLSIENEKSDSEVHKDEPCASFEQQLSFNYSREPLLSDELLIKSDSEPYSDSLLSLGAEDTKTTSNNQDDFSPNIVSGSEDIVAFSYEQNALNILEALGTGNSFQMSTELNNELKEQILSDLVYEALYDVYSIFEAYWPTPLCCSSNYHIHLLPNTEHHVTRKFQSWIEKLLSLSLKISNSMDNVVSYDLAQGGGWMNLQAEAESLGLTLDEMIFDELIEEFMYE